MNVNTMSDFKRKLRNLINCYNVENGSNTPDFILAEYLTNCLETFDKAVRKRDRWYGEDRSPFAPNENSVVISYVTNSPHGKSIEENNAFFPNDKK